MTTHTAVLVHALPPLALLSWYMHFHHSRSCLGTGTSTTHAPALVQALPPLTLLSWYMHFHHSWMVEVPVPRQQREWWKCLYQDSSVSGGSACTKTAAWVVEVHVPRQQREWWKCMYHSRSCLGTFTSIKSGGVKLIFFYVEKYRCFSWLDNMSVTLFFQKY
jgi:hypothetical protein